MKIWIEEKAYVLSEESITSILKSIEFYISEQYQKLPSTTKLTAMATVRAMLMYAETKEPDPEKRKFIRPPKGDDPALHLIRLLLKALGEALPHVECEITTEHEYISNFSFQHAGSGGRQVSADGNIREWENNSSKATGQGAD